MSLQVFGHKKSPPQAEKGSLSISEKILVAKKEKDKNYNYPEATAVTAASEEIVVAAHLFHLALFQLVHFMLQSRLVPHISQGAA